MRILIAASVSSEREGGVANVVHNTAQSLARRGHSVSCWFREDIVYRQSRSHPLETIDIAYHLANKIRKRRTEFDVTILHAPIGFAYGWLRWLKHAKTLPPYVMFLHGIEERRNHAMSREAKKARAPYFRFRNRVWQHLYQMPLYRWAIVTANCSVVINRETWTTLQLKYGRDPERVWYVPNGVEPRFFCEEDFREGPALKLLFVGTWLDHKGIYYLRDAFEVIARRFPDLQLTIAGCRAEAQAVRDWFSPAIRQAVNVIPFVPTSEMPPLYLRHDVFVLPSLMEGLPIALLEAMATARPVVTTETCGMVDVIEHEHNGLLVKPADTQGLVAAMLRLVESRDLRAQLGRAAQETARRHTWERFALDLERVIECAVSDVSRSLKK